MAFELTITTAGYAAIAALMGTDTVTISEIGVSSAVIVPDPADTTLTGELKRLTTFGGIAPDSATISLQILDNSADIYDLKSFALYLDDGTLFALYGQATSILEKASGSLLLLETDITLAAIDSAALNFGDTNFVNPPASESIAGVSKIADDASILAGTATDKHITPKGLFDNILSLVSNIIDINLAPNGHIVLFGLIVNWGTSTVIAYDNSATLTFSKEYTAQCYIALPMVKTTGPNDDVWPMLLATSLTNVTIARGSNGGILTSGTLGYIALGK